MKSRPWLTVLSLLFAVSSILFGMQAYLAKEREMRRRISVEESLMRATRAKLQIEQELETQKGKSAILEREFLGLQRTNRFTLVRLRGLEWRFSNLQREFGQLKKEKRSLEAQTAQLRGHPRLAGSEEEPSVQEVDLGQIVVSATPTLEGKVLAVNRPFQFVVVNLGNEENLSVGSVLSIYRGSDFIGRIQVEEVREDVAACRILSEWTREEIREEDLVKEL